MAEPTLTINDVITRYEQQGLSDKEISVQLKSRGINLEGMGDQAGKTKVRMTVGEFVDSASAAGAVGTDLRSDLFRRGILNATKLSEEDFARVLPPSKADLTVAEHRLLDDYESDFKAGKYEGWKWDNRAGSGGLAHAALGQIYKNNPRVNYNLVEQYRNQDLYEDSPGMGGALELGGNDSPPLIPLSALNAEEQELYKLGEAARETVSKHVLYGRAAGAAAGAVTVMADLLGVEPGSTTGNTLAALLTSTDGWTKSRHAPTLKEGAISKAILLKDTPAGQELARRAKKKAIANIQDLAEMSDNPGLASSVVHGLKGKGSVTIDRASVENALGKRRGEKYTKGYLKTHGVHQEKMADQIRFYLRLDNRMNTEKNFDSFSEWFDTALPDSLKINIHNKARLARVQLDKSFRSQARDKEGNIKPLTGRALNEAYEIVQGLYSMTSFLAAPGKSSQYDDLYALVESGKMTADAAGLIASSGGWEEGSSAVGGIAAYMMPYTLGDSGSLEDQIMAEPVQHILSALPVLSILKGMKAAGAARAMTRLQKIAKQAGVPDEHILKAIDVGQELVNDQQKGMLRKWLDTARGKHANNGLLEGLDKAGVPEIATGMAKGALLGLGVGGDGDTLFLGAVGGGLGGAKHLIKSSAVWRRRFGDLAAQSKASGQIVTNDMMASLEELRGDQAALNVALENELRNGNVTADTVARIMDSVRAVNESGKGKRLETIIQPVFDRFDTEIKALADGESPDVAGLSQALREALLEAQAKGAYPDFYGAIDTGGILDMLARQRALVDNAPEVRKARAEYAAVIDKPAIKASAGTVPQKIFRHHEGFKKLLLSDLIDVKHGNTINPKQLSKLKESIKTKGFKQSKSDGPVMVRIGEDGAAEITEGNHRVKALKDLAKEGKIKPDQLIEVFVGYNADLFYAGEKAWIPASKVTPVKGHSAPSGLASEAKKVARENIGNAKAHALNRFVEGADGEGGLNYVKTDKDFAESTGAILTQRAEIREQNLADIAEIEAGKEDKLRAAADDLTQEGMRKHVTNLEGRIKKQQEAIASNEKKLKEGEDAVQAEFDKGVANLGSDIKARQGQAAKGKKISRADDLEKAEREFRNREYGYNDAVNGVRLAQRVAPEYRGPVVKSAQKKLDNAEKMLRRADEKLDNIKADFDDPKVKRGGKNLSFAQEMKRLEKAREKGLAKLDKERNRISKHEAASAELMSSIKDIELAVGNLIEGEVLSFPTTDAPYKKVAGTYTTAEGAGQAFIKDTLPEKRRARIVSDENKRIEKIKAKDAASEAKTREVLDRIARSRAAGYRRALATAHGLKVVDGDYVARLEVPAMLNPETLRVEGLGKGDFPEDDYVILPNGRLGKSQNFDLSVGNLLTQMASFPGEDVPALIGLLDNFADISLANVDGIAKSGWAREVQKASKGTKGGIEDVIGAARDDLKKSARAKATLSDDWASDATKALLEGRMSNRGVNDLKRMIMETYGDMIVNAGTNRILTDTGIRNRFQKFTMKVLKEVVFGKRDKGSMLEGTGMTRLYDARVAEFEKTIGDMALDFAQGRTMDEWSTYARVNHTFLDPEGKPFTFTGSDGNSVPASIENLFKEFSAGELGSTDIYRARHGAFMDTVYLAARAAEGRLVADKAILDATGVSKEIWERGANDGAYQASVYKYYLETGDMPPAFRATEVEGKGSMILDPSANSDAKAVLESLVGDPSINTRGVSYVEALNGIADSLYHARRQTEPKLFDRLFDRGRSQDYVRLGGELDNSNIPGVTRVGAKPLMDPGLGIVSKHDIIQPEHTRNIAADASAVSGEKSDIFIRREFADSIGWMLDTHTKLQADTASIGFLKGLNALWKWGKTAGSLMNPLTNYASNTKTFMVNQGTNPVSAFIAPAKMSVIWREYRAGGLAGTSTAKRLDALMKTGFSDQSQLIAEVDKVLQNLYSNGQDKGFVRPFEQLYREGKIKGHRLPGYRELNELQDRMYRTFGDELFKLTDSMIEWDKIVDRIDAGSSGQALHIRNIDTGGGFETGQFLGSIMKTDDGYAVVMKHGKNKNKVIKVDSLDDPAAANLIAKGAMGHANSLYYNLGKSGTLVKRGKNFESIFMQPFISWRTKAMDIPMVKKGMMYRMFMDDNYLMSDSPLVNLQIYGEIAARQSRRAFWTAAGRDHSQDTPAIRSFLPRWARRAIISGSGAAREFFNAESSNPIGGFITFLEFLVDSNKLVSGDEGESTFWDRVHNEKAGPMPTITRIVNESFGQGSVTQLIWALAGYDSLRKRPMETSEERIVSVIKNLAPGWVTRTGLADAVIQTATLGAVDLEFGSVPEIIFSEAEAKSNFDPSRLGRQSSQKLLQGGPAFVSIYNAMMGRKYRRMDPVFMTKLAMNLPSRITKEMLKIAKEAQLKGLGPDDADTQAKLSALRDAKNAYKEHIPRMMKALGDNGVENKDISELVEYYEKKKSQWEKEGKRLERLP